MKAELWIALGRRRFHVGKIDREGLPGFRDRERRFTGIGHAPVALTVAQVDRLHPRRRKILEGDHTVFGRIEGRFHRSGPEMRPRSARRDLSDPIRLGRDRDAAMRTGPERDGVRGDGAMRLPPKRTGHQPGACKGTRAPDPLDHQILRSHNLGFSGFTGLSHACAPSSLTLRLKTFVPQVA